MKKISNPAALFMLLVLSLGCRDVAQKADERHGTEPASPCGIRFEEIGETAGLNFQHFQATRAALLPEDNGSGLAFGDYDNDGWDDLYVANIAGPVLMPRDELVSTRGGGRLFHNQGDGTFRDVTRESGLVHVGWDNAAVWADTDGDGWLDLVIAGIGEVALFRNRGDGTFEDHSHAAGLGPLECLASSASLSDFDRDGDLDLYVPCYVEFPWERARDRPLVGGRPATMTTPADYPPQPDMLFENDGQGRFRDIAADVGLFDTTGRGLQAIFVDLDDDGWQDLYVANDQSFDRLYRNLGRGEDGRVSFENVTITAGARDPRAGMGVGVGDYDGDGSLDLFLTHWVGEQNALYRNLSTAGEILLEDRTYEEGLGPVDGSWVGWGTGFADFDLDADLDMLLVNGSTVEDEWTLEVLSDPKMIPQPARVYERRDEGFVDISECAGSFFSELVVGRGLAFSDIDRDGLVDFALAVHNGRLRLLRNVTPATGHWLAVELVGQGKNPWAVGAKVTVKTALGRQVRPRLAGESYASSNSTTLHFGLGKAEAVEQIEVRWPTGETGTYVGPIPADRTVRLHQGDPQWQNMAQTRRASRPWGAPERSEHQAQPVQPTGE